MIAIIAFNTPHTLFWVPESGTKYGTYFWTGLGSLRCFARIVLCMQSTTTAAIVFGNSKRSGFTCLNPPDSVCLKWTVCNTVACSSHTRKQNKHFGCLRRQIRTNMVAEKQKKTSRFFELGTELLVPILGTKSGPIFAQLGPNLGNQIWFPK